MPTVLIDVKLLNRLERTSELFARRDCKIVPVQGDWLEPIGLNDPDLVVFSHAPPLTDAMTLVEAVRRAELKQVLTRLLCVLPRTDELRLVEFLRHHGVAFLTTDALPTLLERSVDCFLGLIRRPVTRQPFICIAVFHFPGPIVRPFLHKFGIGHI